MPPWSYRTDHGAEKVIRARRSVESGRDLYINGAVNTSVDGGFLHASTPGDAVIWKDLAEGGGRV